MTMARPVYREQVVMVSRRTVQRQLLFVPDDVINGIFLYCLGYAAKKYKIKVISVTVMSNHWHVVIFDEKGTYPAFTSWMHEFTAKCVNVYRKRYENVWSSEKGSVVRAEDDEDVLGQVVYCECNPVEAGLVADRKDWPGIRLGPAQWGKTIEVKRPSVYFSKTGRMPKKVKLTLHRPPIKTDLSDAVLAQQFMNATDAKQKELVECHKQAGKVFMGANAVKRQSPFSQPRTEAPRRNLNPQVAAKNKGRRIAALKRLKQFWSDYKKAYARWRTGTRDVVFPHGTYAVCVFGGAISASTS